MKLAFGLTTPAIVLLATMSAVAMAAEPLILQVDKTQLLTVSELPGTVVIGNPSIADATINGKQIFVHGYSYGDTNLIILNAAGKQIANFDMTVTNNSANALSIYKAGNRMSYTCAPNCEVTMIVGDPFDYTQKVISTNQAKQGFATGKTSSQVAAPAPAQ